MDKNCCLVAVAFAQQLCSSSTYSTDLSVKIPLLDQSGKPSYAEISQRFDVAYNSDLSLYVSFSCVKLFLGCSANYNNFNGFLVVRTSDPKTFMPGDVIYKIKTKISPYQPGWYVHDDHFTVEVPRQAPVSGYRSFYLGFQTESNQEVHPIMYAAERDKYPQTGIWFATNVTPTWDPLYLFYSHVGMDADFVIY